MFDFQSVEGDLGNYLFVHRKRARQWKVVTLHLTIRL